MRQVIKSFQTPRRGFHLESQRRVDRERRVRYFFRLVRVVGPVGLFRVLRVVCCAVHSGASVQTPWWGYFKRRFSPTKERAVRSQSQRVDRHFFLRRKLLVHALLLPGFTREIHVPRAPFKRRPDRALFHDTRVFHVLPRVEFVRAAAG